MKTTTITPVHVAPDSGLERESMLEQRSLSEFGEHPFRTKVARRTNQAEFIRRGIAAIEATKHGGGMPAEVVIAKLGSARQAKAQRAP